MAHPPAAAVPPGLVRPVSPWIDRLFAAAPLSPAAAGLAIAALLFAGLVAIEWRAGRFQVAPEQIPDLARNLRIGTVMILLIGYLVAAHRYLGLWTVQIVRELAPALALSDRELDAVVAEVGTASSRNARRAGVFGILLAACGGPLADLGVSQYFTREYWSPETASHWLAVPILGWLAGRLMFGSMVECGRVSRLAERLREIDLLDLRPLTPFARQGLWAALLWLLFIAILSLLLTNRGFGPLLAFFGLLTLYFAVRALLLPVRRVRDRIVAAKRAELERVRGEIRRDREALRALADDGHAAAARLPGLLAYESRIEGVREWPFDAPTLARFLLYLVIPLGSWLGGALAERALGAILD